MRVTFNPNITSVSPIKRVAPKYRARSTGPADTAESEDTSDVVITLSAEARAMALQHNRARSGAAGIWTTLSKMLKGEA